MIFLAALGYVASLVAVSAAVLLARDRLRPRRPSAPPTEVLHPRWDEVEAGLGRPAPRVLRELYADPERLSLDYHEIVQPLPGNAARVWDVNGFAPADGTAVDAGAHNFPPGSFIFADNLMGGLYYVVLSPGEDGDGPVFLEDHGDTEHVADSLRDLLSWRVVRD